MLEGLQDLLVQYLQLKLEFGVADVVRSRWGRRGGGATRRLAAGLGGPARSCTPGNVLARQRGAACAVRAGLLWRPTG